MIKNPKLFKTGFINQVENDSIRIKQSLPTQEIANACISFVNTSKDLYMCNNQNLHPFYSVPYITDPNTMIKDNCPCVRNLYNYSTIRN